MIHIYLDVNESEIFEKKQKKNNILDKYNEKYYNIFNNIYSYILHNKFAAVSSKTYDINIVSETIRKNVVQNYILIMTIKLQKYYLPSNA